MRVKSLKLGLDIWLNEDMISLELEVRYLELWSKDIRRPEVMSWVLRAQNLELWLN